MTREERALLASDADSADPYWVRVMCAFIFGGFGGSLGGMIGDFGLPVWLHREDAPLLLVAAFVIVGMALGIIVAFKAPMGMGHDEARRELALGGVDERVFHVLAAAPGPDVERSTEDSSWTEKTWFYDVGGELLFLAGESLDSPEYARPRERLVLVQLPLSGKRLTLRLEGVELTPRAPVSVATKLLLEAGDARVFRGKLETVEADLAAHLNAGRAA